jgi:hypothetical protein
MLVDRLNQISTKVSADVVRTISAEAVEAWRVRDDHFSSFLSTYANRPSVEDSEELQRILRLPRRPQVDLRPGSAMAQAYVEIMNERLMLPGRKPGECNCICESVYHRPCISSLQPAQALALHEAALVRGLLAPIATGAGKTSLNFLMSVVIPGCKLAVVLIPPNLRIQLYNEYMLWKEHWRVPNLVMYDSGGKSVFDENNSVTLYAVAYSKFSRKSCTDLLSKLDPDLILADEVHKLGNPDTATTGRFLRYVASAAKRKKVFFCGWSGTITSRTIKEYAHLAAIALGDGSPLPIDPHVVDCWSQAIDPSDFPAGPGALKQLCKPEETLYQGLHRRIIETRGVVATTEGAIAASLTFHEREGVKLPNELNKLLRPLREGHWVRPDGEELLDILEASIVMRQLCCGFYYRWRYPRAPRKPGTRELTDEAKALIEEWFAKRKAWFKELREKLKIREEYLDSEELCTNAAKRFWSDPPYKGDLPVWAAESWPAWRGIKDKVYHETETVWVDDYLAKDAAEWAKEYRGIVWYDYRAFGLKVSELSGLPMHAGGPEAEAAILAEKGDRSIIASLGSHGTGRDGLQFLFDKQLFANPCSSAKIWEQALARLHRLGQKSPEVDSWIYRHVVEMSEAFDSAFTRAKYVNGTLGTNQKLLVSNCTFTI